MSNLSSYTLIDCGAMSTTVSGSGYSRTPIAATSATTSITTFDYMGQPGYMGQYQEIDFDQVGFDCQYATGKDGKFCESKVEVRCPHCAYPNHPFMRKKRPVCVETGEEWTGITTKEPFAHYQCLCVYCDEAYVLRLFG